jgi:hypothetical protein
MAIKSKSNAKFSYAVPQFKGLILAAFEPLLKDYAYAEESTLKNQILSYQPATRVEDQG